MKIEDIQAATRKVTKKWAAQRRREERAAGARECRDEYMDGEGRISQAEIAESVIPRAYSKASDGGRLPAHARQIYYAARPEIEDWTERRLDSVYFTQTLLPRYMNRHPETESWRVVFDARGHLLEPHTDKVVPLGTLAVDEYLGEIYEHRVDDLEIEKLFDRSYPTIGPANRWSAILFIEKEGFHPLFKEVNLAERYDLAIMSTKGQSVVASRRLVDELCSGDVPLLVLHDFDREGFSIAQRLTRVPEAARWNDRIRYEFQNEVNAVDLGLRLADVREWDLPSEYVTFRGQFDPDSIATPEEREFLRGNQRVELNAFTSADFVRWVEAKLEEHGIRKVVPDDATLEHAYRRAYGLGRVNTRMRGIFAEAVEEANGVAIPPELTQRVHEALRDAPHQPWDRAIVGIVDEVLAEADRRQT